MRSVRPLTLTTLALLLAGVASAAPQRITQDFDAGWRYSWSDPAQAFSAAFDDHAWTAITLPHDASIAGPIDNANPSGPAGGFFPTGVVWYRKSFTLPAGAPPRAYVVFDGVMANSDVYLNGTLLGHRPNGTVSFDYDLTPHLQAGVNVIAVRCDTSQQPASRWYEGLGIYRPVHIVLTNVLHIAPWSTFVTTPSVSPQNATVHIAADIANDAASPVKAALQVALVAPDGHIAGTATTPLQQIGADGSGHFAAQIVVPIPQRWDTASPKLYTAQVRVVSAGKRVDEVTQPFGIREFHFEAATGFWLNGRNFQLYGAAVHIDGGAVGIAVPTAVWERRLKELRALGVNAIRTAHNPPSPQFLDLCDRMGILVMDELFDCWTVGKNPYDYHLFFNQWALRDLEDTVRRDRNHPSIILYSAGNEIHDTPQANLAHWILTALVEDFHKNDPTRPVTQALFRPNVSHDYDNGLADLLDVVGQNYRQNELLAAHTQNPARKILGTENTHDRNQWLALRDHPEMSGQFLWTGVDYLGEAGQWPLIDAPFGLIDRIGVPHARGYERQSWWSPTPNVHIARRIAADDPMAVDPGYETVPLKFKQTLYTDWNPRNPNPHIEDVEVYTNCAEVDLLLNGTSLGRQKLHADASPLIWKVPYAPGSLQAVAYNRGQSVALDELRTAAAAARVVLTTERRPLAADREDVAYIMAQVVDAQGVLVPDAANLIHFQVEGPGEIVAVDNSSDLDHDSFVAQQRKAFEGRAAALVRATASSGTVRISAHADGLSGSSVQLSTAPPMATVASPAF